MGVMKTLATMQMMGENIAPYARACGVKIDPVELHEYQHEIMNEIRKREERQSRFSWEIAEDLSNPALQQLINEEKEHVTHSETGRPSTNSREDRSEGPTEAH